MIENRTAILHITSRTTPAAFAKACRNAMEAYGIPMKTLAKTLGVNESSVSRMLSGRLDPKLTTVAAYIGALEKLK